MTRGGGHRGVLLRSMLEICERSMRKADCGTVAASRQATCAGAQPVPRACGRHEQVGPLACHAGPACTRVKTRSVRPMRAALAGTKEPTWARNTMRATCLA